MTAETPEAADLRENPLLVREGLPPFDRIEARHVVPAVRHVLAEAERALTDLEPHLQPTWDGSVEPLDRIGLPFQWAWGPVGHLFSVKNSPELRQAYETVLPDMVAFGLRVRQSEPIYRALKRLRDGDGWSRLDEAQRRIVEDKLRDAELSGIALTGAKRERFNRIEAELSQLSTEFANHVLDATKAFSLVLTELDEVDGLPASLRNRAAQSYNEMQRAEGKEGPPATPERGPWRITLDVPSFMPFMQHSRRRDLREPLYRAHVTRAAQGELDNTPLIDRILRLRREKAHLLGFRSYAELSLATKMAPDVAAVEAMFDRLRQASWEPAEADLKDLVELSCELGMVDVLAHWDIAYYAERLRETRFQFTEEELRPYFSLDRVLRGLFDLCRRLFGVTVAAADGEAPVWHPDVRFFRLFDESGAPVAAFYLDPYSRPENKRPGAWMNDCFDRRRMDDGRWQLPVAHLVCNATPPVGETPSLMTFREVETLFHEFGHGLQHMLTRVDYPDAAGIHGIEWDAVELPSQFMENWCYHKPTLLGLSAHYQTGEPLPDELFEKIRAAKNYRSGTMMLRQLQFGMLDMELHDRYDPDGAESVWDVQRRIAARTQILPPLPEDRSLCSFQHIFAGGYAAGYYSYKWAEVLSADAFAAFEEAGLDNEPAVAATGRRFRDTVLALGGGRHPMEVFQAFRGRQPSPEPLLRHSGLA